VKPGRNDPCICGSGKKYKHCCSNLSQADTLARQAGWEQGSLKEPTANEQNHLIALYQTGRNAELEKQAHLLLERYPDSGFGWKILSAALIALDKDAFSALQQTAELLPHDAQVHNNLGDLQAKREMLAEAEASFRQAILIEPAYADAHYNLGQVLARLSRHVDAEKCFRNAIKFKPNDADTYSNLGSTLLELEQYIEAETILRHALTLKPSLPEAYNSLARSLMDQERYIEAETCLRQALALRPNWPEVYSNLGGALRGQYKYVDAEASFRRALELKPDLFEANCGLGSELVEQGKLGEAEALFRRALAIRPDAAMTHYSLVHTKKIKPGDTDFESLIQAEKALGDEAHSIPPRESIYLHFGLGKCFDDIGNYDQAFTHYLKGCQLKRSTFDYAPLDDTKIFDEIIRVFNAEKIESLRGNGAPSERPIFVLGMPRSGTTLTEQIIASHPDVYGAGELIDLLTITQRDIGLTGFPNSLHLLDPKHISAWGSEYAAALQKHAPNARRITDKMPHNFMVVGLIHLMLPNAKIIHIKRDPVDTCLSCFTKLFVGKNLKYSYELTELAQFYVNYVRLMEHWRKVLPENAFQEVHYEELVQNPEEQARRLIEYCGLEWDAECLDFHKSDRSVRTASMIQVRQPIYQSSMERWRRYEHHLMPLLDVLGDLAPNR